MEKFLIGFVAFIMVFTIALEYATAQNYNQLKLEDRPADWQPPFPDEEFSFSRFETQSDFNDYLEYRFPVGTSGAEINKIMVEYGGARKRIVSENFYQKENPIVIRYYKWTWQRILGRLLMSPDREAFAVFYFDKDLKLVKSFGNAP